MAVQRRGGTAVGQTSSPTTLSLTIPANVVAGDRMLIVMGYNPDAATGGTLTAPAGWTLVAATGTLGGGTFISHLYERTASGGDAGTVVTFTNTVGQRMAGALEAYFSTSGRNVYQFNATAVNGTSHTQVSATSTAAGGSMVAIAERSSTPTTAFTPPAGYTLRNAGYSTGNGSVSVAAADSLTTIPSGSTIGGGTWTGDVATTNTFTWVVGLTDTAATNQPPTANAGADVTNGQVGVPVSVTGSGTDPDGTVTGYAWTCTAYPPGSSAPTLTGASTATVQFTPSATGVYILSLVVTDNDGATSPADTVSVFVPGTVVRAVALTSNPGGWAQYGSEANLVTALGDTSDATGIVSSTATANPSLTRWRLDPLIPPQTLSFDLREQLSVAGSGTMKVRLYEGATLRKEWTAAGGQVPTTTVSTGTFTLSSGEIAAVTSWLALDLEIEWGV